MSSHALISPGYTRLDPQLSGRFRGAAAKPTKAQSALELTLFAVFGLSIVLSGIALYSLNSPEHQMVPNRVADGMTAGRVNVLVIASSRNGKNSTTESLSVVSLRPGSAQAALIALPRDLWVKVGRYGSHRLGAALAIGENSGYPGEGAGLMSDTVENVIGQPIHAYVRIDAGDLRSTIDAVGGIDVVVPHAFIERKNKDYFAAGPVHLNGERAVRYAQSTAVRGPQGVRVAREARQQQVIAAVVEKLTRRPDVRERLALSPLFSAGQSATNLTRQQVDQLCSQLVAANDLKRVNLEPLISQFEVRSFFDAGEAVRPRTGDYGKVQELARNVFAGAQPIATFH